MKVLVIGSGGREHALCWKLSQSPKVSKIYCAPGNGGTKDLAENVNLSEVQELLDFAKENEIDLTVVGPEKPLVEGIADRFMAEGLRIFGVNQRSARLEGSKIYSKNFMEKYDIPTAKHRVYRDYSQARADLDRFNYPIVIKADGLCSGKGVVICQDRAMAEDCLDDFFNKSIFGQAGENIIIEEFLEGVEASLLCFVSRGRIVAMESAKDYKQIYDGDQGPNTGGVGCFSPSPLFTDELKKEIEDQVIVKIEKGLKEEKLDFTGILFIGFMISEEINVLEFNVRFGDPETEVVLPRLKSDLFDILNKTIDGDIGYEDLSWDERPCMTVVATSEGYPAKPILGREISFGELDPETIVFHNGTRQEEDRLLTSGGRVVSVTRLGESLPKIREEIYLELDKLEFLGAHYRKDIGLIKG